MPNRRRYKHRVPFSTSFEGDFLDEFRRECCEAEDKDVNEKLHSLMEGELRRKHTIQEQQKLSIYGNRADLQNITEKQQLKTPPLPPPATLQDIMKQIEELLEQLPKAIITTTTPPPKDKYEFRGMAQQIAIVQRLLNDGNKMCNIQQEQLRRKTAMAGVMI